MNGENPLAKFREEVRLGLRPKPVRKKGQPPKFTIESSKHRHGIADRFIITIFKQNGTITVREHGRRKTLAIDIGEWYLDALRREAGITKRRKR